MLKIGFLIFTLVMCQGYAVPDDDWEDFWDYNEVDSDTNSTIEGTELEDMIPELNATTDSPTLPEDLKVSLNLETIPELMDSLPKLNALVVQLQSETNKDPENTLANDLVSQLIEATEDLNDKLNGSLNDVLQSAQRILQSSKTCTDLANHGITESGMYPVDPDGFGIGTDPIMVHCNFATNTTEIYHDHEEPDDIYRCGLFFKGKGCHRTSLEYSAPMSQITALASASASCEQDIKFKCYLAPLREYGRDNLGFWLDKNGTERTFFHGEANNFNQSYGCQCGINQTCIHPSLACNCDAKVPEWLADEGKITDKNILPITEFAYGPLEYDARQASIEIGNLKCSGTSLQRVRACGYGGVLSDEAQADPEITRDDCDDAELVNSHRLKIRLNYSSSRNCKTVLKLPKPTKMKLTISDFVTETDYDHFYVHDGGSVGANELKNYHGDMGDITYEWTPSGDRTTFYWKTDGDTNMSSMTAYVDF